MFLEQTYAYIEDEIRKKNQLDRVENKFVHINI
jgi:hypothetical protein